MARDPDWDGLLASFPEPKPLTVDSYQGPLGASFARPHVFKASDGHEYVVKLARPGEPEQVRALVADQVIGRLANWLNAAVPAVMVVEIEAGMLPATEDASAAGVAHASFRIPLLSDRQGISHVNENRERLARLAVLYTWGLQTSDHQICLEPGAAAPRIWSVDHGHFFPNGPVWTVADLDNEADPTMIDGWFTGPGITRTDCVPAAKWLTALTPTRLAIAARSARNSWGVSDDERAAICRYLWRRRAALLRILPPPP